MFCDPSAIHRAITLLCYMNRDTDMAACLSQASAHLSLALSCLSLAFAHEQLFVVAFYYSNTHVAMQSGISPLSLSCTKSWNTDFLASCPIPHTDHGPFFPHNHHLGIFFPMTSNVRGPITYFLLLYSYYYIVHYIVLTATQHVLCSTWHRPDPCIVCWILPGPD